MLAKGGINDKDVKFQCSSASRKFLNPTNSRSAQVRMMSFSALQRAENSSMEVGVPLAEGILRFQCSSASRKFLNLPLGGRDRSPFRAFQCSSASRKFLNVVVPHHKQPALTVSVLFSEPKIPQCVGGRLLDVECDVVSVLFSEPKIPQWDAVQSTVQTALGFSALQRAENSSIEKHSKPCKHCSGVSVLFSEPKIPQFQHQTVEGYIIPGFSALQRAENSSIPRAAPRGAAPRAFQCSSASRKFLNVQNLKHPLDRDAVSVLFSEPKIPQSLETSCA